MGIEWNSLGSDWPFDVEPETEGNAKQELIHCAQIIADDLGDMLHANRHHKRELSYEKLLELEQRLVNIIKRFS